MPQLTLKEKCDDSGLTCACGKCNGVGPRELSDMAELLIILSSEIITSFSRVKNLLSADR